MGNDFEGPQFFGDRLWLSVVMKEFGTLVHTYDAHSVYFHMRVSKYVHTYVLTFVALMLVYVYMCNVCGLLHTFRHTYMYVRTYVHVCGHANIEPKFRLPVCMCTWLKLVMWFIVCVLTFGLCTD